METRNVNISLPNFLLVGAPKAGTTSVFNYLAKHPDMFLPKIKEPNYFVDVGPHSWTVDKINSRKDYEKLFANRAHQRICGEASVSYMHCEKAPQFIYSELGKVFILMIIRDPVDRCYSHWHMNVREGYEKLSFIDAVEKDFFSSEIKGFCYSHMYVECSLYAAAIERYQAIFGDHVKVVLYDDCVKNIKSVMEDIFDFLGLEQVNIDFSARYNEAAEPRNLVIKKLFHQMWLRENARKMLPQNMRHQLRKAMTKRAAHAKPSLEERNKLMAYFQEDIELTEKLINKNLSDWKKI